MAEERGLPYPVETLEEAWAKLQVDPVTVKRYGKHPHYMFSFIRCIETGWVFKTREPSPKGLFHWVVVGKDGIVQHDHDAPLSVLADIKRKGVCH